MPVTVRTSPEAIARVMAGCTVVIERARGPSYFGETGAPKDFFNLTTCTSRNVLAQGDTADELRAWALKQGAKHAEVL